MQILVHQTFPGVDNQDDHMGVMATWRRKARLSCSAIAECLYGPPKFEARAPISGRCSFSHMGGGRPMARGRGTGTPPRRAPHVRT